MILDQIVEDKKEKTSAAHKLSISEDGDEQNWQKKLLGTEEKLFL